MPAKNNRPDARRDANEPEIVKELESHGYVTHRIGNPGDLLIWNHETRHWVCLEVKMPEGRLTPKQRDYRRDNPDIDIPIVETPAEALREVFVR